jgi:hypothetical protein
MDFEIDIGRIQASYASLTMKVRVEGGRAQVMLYIAPAGRGNGGLIMLGAMDYRAFRDMIGKADAILGGAATNGKPLLLKE